MSIEVVTVSYSGCHMTRAMRNCCRLGASSEYPVQSWTSWQCHLIRSHIRGMHVCLAVTCHQHFWQNDRDSLRATAVKLGWSGHRSKNRTAQKADPEKENSLAALAWTRARDLSITTLSLYHWAIPAPCFMYIRLCETAASSKKYILVRLRTTFLTSVSFPYLVCIRVVYWREFDKYNEQPSAGKCLIEKIWNRLVFLHTKRGKQVSKHGA